MAAAVLGAALLAGPAGAVDARRAETSSAAHLRVEARSLAPRMFMLMSLPVERKVSYAELSNFQAVGGVIRPLVDSGVRNPRGIAYHEADSTIFVADSDQRKIFRWKLSVKPCPKAGCACDSTGATCGLKYEVSTIGTRVTIMEDVLTQWVTLDSSGNLYYSDLTTNSVNRLSRSAIRQVANGNIRPSDLHPSTESQQEALAAAAAATGSAAAAAPVAAVAMYQAGESPHVGVPGGVVADSTEVYWANQAGGATAGTVGVGAQVPQTPVLSNGTSSAPVFATYQMAGSIDSAYGIAQTDSLIIFTGNSNNVYCVPKSGSAGGVATPLTDGVLSPRGVVWDGDSTTFVADESADTIYSLPSGHCAAGVPIQQAAYVHGPFGLALIKTSAPAFQQAMSSQSSSWFSWW